MGFWLESYYWCTLHAKKGKLVITDVAPAGLRVGLGLDLRSSARQMYRLDKCISAAYTMHQFCGLVCSRGLEGVIGHVLLGPKNPAFATTLWTGLLFPLEPISEDMKSHREGGILYPLHQDLLNVTVLPSSFCPQVVYMGIK